MPLLSRSGHDLFIAILGEGITSRYEQRESADQSQLHALHQDARDVAKLMGARELFLEQLPDNRFDSLPMLHVVKVVESLVNKVGPAVIYTHHPGDLNVDHCVVHRAVLTATRPKAGMCVKEIYACEVPSSTEWAFHQFPPTFRPNVFQDISQTLDIKIRAMNMYRSEVCEYPHPRSPRALEAVSRRWGALAGVEAAEAFELIRCFR